MRKVKYLILGNGIAGRTAANQLREYCEEEEILIVTREAEKTIRRPLLSKTAFQGFTFGVFDLETDTKKIPVWEYTEIQKIYPREHVVETDRGKIGYDACVYALGAGNFIPPIKGTDLKGVFSVRTEEDYLQIRRAARSGENVIIIGGGVIGMEMAELFVKEGKHVTVLETQSRLLPRMLDETCAAYYQKKLMEACPDRLVVECNVKGIELCGDDHICRVAYGDKLIKADMAVFACGVRPSLTLAKEAGIATGRGILTDEFMRTSEADLYACGDCVEFESQIPALWKPAIQMAETAAQNILGNKVRYQTKAFPVMITSSLCSLYAAGMSVETDTDKAEITWEQNVRSQSYMITQKEETVFEKTVRKNGVLCGKVMIGNLSDQSGEEIQV